MEEKHEDLDDVAITDPDGGCESCNLFCSAVARKTDKLNQLIKSPAIPLQIL